MIANRVERRRRRPRSGRRSPTLPDGWSIAAIPESPLLSAPTVPAPWSRPPTAELVLGIDELDWTARRSGIIVAAMSLPNVLARLRPDVAVIAPSDRTDLIPGLMLAHQSGTSRRWPASC